MNALPKLHARVLQKPSYGRWDLVRQNDMTAWIAANREALMAWYDDTNAYLDGHPEPFAVFAADQFDFERMHFEELRADAKLDHDYVDRSDE
jgi:hypothetical protein